MRIRDKKTMYSMLDAGYFGNTVERWYSLQSWLAFHRRGLFAIRSATISGDRTKSRLDIPAYLIPILYQEWYPNGGGEISPMIDHLLTSRMHVHETERGLCVWMVEGRSEVKWREAFVGIGQHYYGVEALLQVRRFLNPNSQEDLRIVLDRFSGHVVELTTTSCCIGTVPHRNAVIWEVRDY